ncbi:unnamed protein product [Effrenium voratum]|uniref:Exostosin GT47 domain-containing protein n=1 Tax=Effrenium voratum TaxID=2562239 RepID=A0AA36JKF1_9DINO|nr:unnamed protein product [Effrenium voratum]
MPCLNTKAVPRPATCDFGLSPCTELRGEGGVFNGYRPYAAEATFLAKLLSGPDEVIVEDPHEASYFLVPFLSSLWCFLSAPTCWVRCASQRPLNSILPLLTYFNASTAHRHLFIGSDSVGDLSQDLQMQVLTLHYGPSPCGPGSGPLITPPPLADDLPVPGRWEFSSKDLFIFTADGIGRRPFRREVVEELAKWQHAMPHLFVVATRDGGSKSPVCSTCHSAPSGPEWAHQIRRAVFCPVLPGDNTFRMRLFHAVLAGCLPVVILFPGGSWYRNQGPPVEWSLPFPGRVDWRGFSVELPFDPSKEALGVWAKRLVPTLLQLDAKEIHRRQALLAEAAPLLRFDFQGHRPDAFTALLDELSERPLEPARLDCFDPRERFDTERCLSGAESVAREEVEIYGVVACCPKWGQEPAEGNRWNSSCNLGVEGVCASFVPSEEEAPAFDGGRRYDPARRHNLRKHLEAMFRDRRSFDEVLLEDQVCM